MARHCLPLSLSSLTRSLRPTATGGANGLSTPDRTPNLPIPAPAQSGNCPPSASNPRHPAHGTLHFPYGLPVAPFRRAPPPLPRPKCLVVGSRLTRRHKHPPVSLPRGDPIPAYVRHHRSIHRFPPFYSPSPLPLSRHSTPSHPPSNRDMSCMHTQPSPRQSPCGVITP